MRASVRVGLVFLALFSVSGCQLTPEGQAFYDRMKVQWNQWFNSAPSSEGAPPKSEAELALMSSSSAKNARANAEILHEMFQVVLLSEPKDRGEFGNWVDTLNQGASFEGVYQGLIHSPEYRVLEKSGRAAAADALRVFAEELAMLEAELPAPTQFEGPLASPLPPVEVVAPPPVLPIEQPASSPTPRDLRGLADRYSKSFVGSSLAVLRRVLGDEALKVIELKEAGKETGKEGYKEKLALWYSKWVVRVAQRRVDFGVPQRNLADEAFHYKWAVENNSDRIRWEVLNRVHRILNEADRQKQ